MSAKGTELGVPDSVRVSVGLEKIRAEETGKSGGSEKASVELFTVKASMAPGISTSNESTPTFSESALAAAELTPSNPMRRAIRETGRTTLNRQLDALAAPKSTSCQDGVRGNSASEGQK
jgi:hypothetical protein